MTQIRPSTSYISGNLWQHCFDEGEFREEERRRREANDGGATMFFSHCWRDPETQARKRQIIGKLSGPAEVGRHGAADPKATTRLLHTVFSWLHAYFDFIDPLLAATAGGWVLVLVLGRLSRSSSHR